MHITKRVKVVAGVSALLGVVVAGGAAFTATGVSTVGQPAGALQFVGGTITQSVSGTVLSDINYGFADYPVDTEVDAVQLVFADDNADGATVTAVLSYGGSGATVNMSCDNVGANTTTDSTDTPPETDTADTDVLTTDFGGSEAITDYPADTTEDTSASTASGTEDWAYCTVGALGEGSVASELDVTSISVTVGSLNAG